MCTMAYNNVITTIVATLVSTILWDTNQIIIPVPMDIAIFFNIYDNWANGDIVNNEDVITMSVNIKR